MKFRTPLAVFALSISLAAAPVVFAPTALAPTGLTAIAFAQEISDEHMNAAAKAIDATNATDSFDAILLQSAASIKDQLIGTSPDKVEEINKVVDEEAVALAARRSDLEGEARRLFAKNFTIEELQTITEFFGSDLGKKYLESTPILARELSKAARVWGAGINRDLTDNVTKRMLAADSN